MLQGLAASFAIPAGVVKATGRGYHDALAYLLSCEVEFELESPSGAGRFGDSLEYEGRELTVPFPRIQGCHSVASARSSGM